MPTTVNYLSNSPHSLTLRLSSPDAVATAVPKATVLAACAEGPLKTRLSRETDWSVFNIGGPGSDELHVRSSMACTVDAGMPTYVFWFTAAGVTVNHRATGLTNIELLLQHSARY